MSLKNLKQFPKKLEEIIEHNASEEEKQAKVRATAFIDLQQAVPNTVGIMEDGKNVGVILTPDAKALVISYAFIGLCELVAHSSGQTVAFVQAGCIKRAMQNLHKDGLFDA